MSVSYTHLDVYKRQGVQCKRQSCHKQCKGIFNANSNIQLKVVWTICSIISNVYTGHFQRLTRQVLSPPYFALTHFAYKHFMSSFYIQILHPRDTGVPLTHNHCLKRFTIHKVSVWWNIRCESQTKQYFVNFSIVDNFPFITKTFFLQYT